MFSGNDGRTLTGRRRATALSVSVAFHALALGALLIFGSYRLVEADAALMDVVFVVRPMTWADARLAVAKELDTARGAEEPAPLRTAVVPEEPQPPAPEPPPPPVRPEDEEPLRLAAIPAPPDAEPYDPFSFGLPAGSILSPFGLSAGGSSYGWTVHESGAGRGSASGSGTPGTGSAKGLPGPAGGDAVKERVLGTETGPRLVKMNKPVYPKYARRMGREGKVVLSILLDEAGRLIEARVLEKAGHGFDEAALEAVRLWKFKPAMENGTPVACRARMAIRFRLDDNT